MTMGVGREEFLRRAEVLKQATSKVEAWRLLPEPKPSYHSFAHWALANSFWLEAVGVANELIHANLNYDGVPRFNKMRATYCLHALERIQKIIQKKGSSDTEIAREARLALKWLDQKTAWLEKLETKAGELFIDGDAQIGHKTSA